VSRGQRNGFPRSLISVFYTAAATFFSKQLLSCPHEAEWTPFQTRCLSENLEAPGIEPRTSGFIARIWSGINSGTPVGYSGRADLSKKQCDMTPETRIVEAEEAAIARQRVNHMLAQPIIEIWPSSWHNPVCRSQERLASPCLTDILIHLCISMLNIRTLTLHLLTINKTSVFSYLLVFHK
jgi:hypothetical protein